MFLTLRLLMIWSSSIGGLSRHRFSHRLLCRPELLVLLFAASFQAVAELFDILSDPGGALVTLSTIRLCCHWEHGVSFGAQKAYLNIDEMNLAKPRQLRQAIHSTPTPKSHIAPAPL